MGWGERQQREVCGRVEGRCCPGGCERRRQRTRQQNAAMKTQYGALADRREMGSTAAVSAHRTLQSAPTGAQSCAEGGNWRGELRDLCSRRDGEAARGGGDLSFLFFSPHLQQRPRQSSPPRPPVLAPRRQRRRERLQAAGIQRPRRCAGVVDRHVPDGAHDALFVQLQKRPRVALRFGHPRPEPQARQRRLVGEEEPAGEQPAAAEDGGGGGEVAPGAAGEPRRPPEGRGGGCDDAEGDEEVPVRPVLAHVHLVAARGREMMGLVERARRRRCVWCFKQCGRVAAHPTAVVETSRAAPRSSSGSGPRVRAERSAGAPAAAAAGGWRRGSAAFAPTTSPAKEKRPNHAKIEQSYHEQPSACAQTPPAETIQHRSPWAKTKDPGPTSMRPTPKVSALARRRGKTRKSTARMALQVSTMRLRAGEREGVVVCRLAWGDQSFRAALL